MKTETNSKQQHRPTKSMIIGATHSSQGEYNMKDIIGNTVEVYKERIENSEKYIAIFNKILNGELEKIFDPSKAYQGDLFTKKGKLKVKFIKDLAWYRKHIKSEYENISHNEKMIETGNFKYNL
jgi:hypothetical protein